MENEEEEKVAAASVDINSVFMDNVDHEEVKLRLVEDQHGAVFTLAMPRSNALEIQHVIEELKKDREIDVFGALIYSPGFDVWFSDEDTAEEEEILDVWLRIYSNGNVTAYVSTEEGTYGIVVPFEEMVEILDSDGDV